MSQQVIINESEIIARFEEYAEKENKHSFEVSPNTQVYYRQVNGDTVTALLALYESVREIPSLMTVDDWVDFLMETLGGYVARLTESAGGGNLPTSLANAVDNARLLIKTIIEVDKQVEAFVDSTKQFL